MRIVLLGSGNVAYHLARAFAENDIKITQIFGRNEIELRQISDETEIPYSTVEPAAADLYIIAVKDDAILEVSQKITMTDCLVVHTSGSMPLETLRGGYRKGVFYPLQTFSKDRPLEYGQIPFFLETESEEDGALLRSIALQISENVRTSSFEERKYIHLAAVFSCNFVNHLYANAQEIASSREIPFHYFHPLIRETALKIETLEPRTAQTGPAVRNDRRVLAMHEELISDPEQLKIYHTMNASIKKMYEL